MTSDRGSDNSHSPSQHPTNKSRGVEAYERFASQLHYVFGWQGAPFQAAEESLEYSAGTFALGDKTAHFRLGKHTPKKPGAFVAVWKRSSSGRCVPFASADAIDVLVVAVEGERAGTFIFPKSALIQHGLIASEGQRGKNGFRVYPPWLSGLNPTALASQQWQSSFFVEWRSSITEDSSVP